MMPPAFLIILLAKVSILRPGRHFMLEKYEETVLKENSGNLVKAMFDYSRASAQIYRPYQIMTSLVLLLGLWPKLTDGVIQVLHSFPALFQKLLSVNMR